jgi:hypothetical protein
MLLTGLMWIVAGVVGTSVFDGLSRPLAALAGLGAGLVLAYPVYTIMFHIGVWFGERGFGRLAALFMTLALLAVGLLPPIGLFGVWRVRTLANLAWACHLADWRYVRAFAAQAQMRRALRLAARNPKWMLLVAQAFAAEAGRLVDRGWLASALEMAQMAEEGYERAGAYGDPQLTGEAQRISMTVIELRRAVGSG